MVDNNIEILKIYYDEFKYRHQHYWMIFFRSSAAILLLILSPFIYGEKVKSIGNLILFLPVFAIILSIVSYFLLDAEYRRLNAVNETMKSLRNRIGKEVEMENVKPSSITKSVGEYVNFLFFISFLILSVLDIIVIWWYNAD